jgi:hypothetical protein
MLQERKGFFYEPELLDYKPVYARPDMNIMLKIIEAGAEKVAHQQDMLNKVEDSVRKTPAYLDQDVDYVGNVTKQIDTEISGMMDGTVDLLDPANTGKVMQIAKRYMYDPELAKITSRTGKISKSQEQIEAMRKANKISAANYWEFNQSILGANSEFASSKKYNPDVNLHYDIVPYGDPRGENMETLKTLPLHTITTTIFSADGRWLHDRTIKAVNPQMAANIQYAKGEEKAIYIAENDKQLTAMFVSAMSDGAKQQLIAEAKMHGAKTEDDYQAYIQKSVLGVVDMANDADISDGNYKVNEYTKMQMEQSFAITMQKAKIKAESDAADLAFKRAKELKEMETKEGLGGNMPAYGATTTTLPQPSKLGMSAGNVTPYAITQQRTKVKTELNNFSKTIAGVNNEAQTKLNGQVAALVAAGKLPKGTTYTTVIKPKKNADGTISYEIVNNVPANILNANPNLKYTVSENVGIFNTALHKLKQLEVQETELGKIAAQIDGISGKNGGKSAEEYARIVKEVEDEMPGGMLFARTMAIRHPITTVINGFRSPLTQLFGGDGFKILEDQEIETIKGITGGKATTAAEYKQWLISQKVNASKDAGVKEIKQKLDENFNSPQQVTATAYYPNPKAGVNSQLTPALYNQIEYDILNTALSDVGTAVIDDFGKPVIDPEVRSTILNNVISNNKSAEDETISAKNNYSNLYTKIGAKWYMMVNVPGKTTGKYKIQLADQYVGGWLQTLNLDTEYNYNLGTQIEAESQLYGEATVPGTNATYSPNPSNMFNEGVPEPELQIAGETIPYDLNLNKPSDVTIFYETVEKNKQGKIGTKEEREKWYRAGLSGIGFGPTQINNIFSKNPDWFK